MSTFSPVRSLSTNGVCVHACVCVCVCLCVYTGIVRGGDSSEVRALDSWLKGCGFESLWERQEKFLLQGQLSVLFPISVSVPPPVLPQQNVIDPGHSAKSAGGRLQLNTHSPYLCGFAWSYMVHGTHNAPRRQQIHVASAMPRWKYTTSVDIQKTRYKQLFTRVEAHTSAVSLLESGE